MESIATKFINTWGKNTEYFNMLRLMASLSKLFSDNTTPYLDYRLAENIFCKYFNAINDARSCTAYDARIGNLGIGIKTFGIQKGHSTEKIAEFNKLKPHLDPLKGDDLARKISQFRNDRILYANETYAVTDSIYHIVGRIDGKLRIFNSPYTTIDLDKIEKVDDTEKSISFYVGDDYYNFNKSKSVLMKQFILPKEHAEIEVNFIDDPLELLAKLLINKDNEIKTTGENVGEIIFSEPPIKGVDYVVLPLYSTKGKDPIVPERSGLNQWNAGGRDRNENELYIPVPAMIHQYYHDFFPNKDTTFELLLPNGRKLNAKICQDGGKALMSNPNSDLGEWILRTILHKKPGELVTMDDLYHYGIDSVLVQKHHRKNEDGQEVFSISFTVHNYENYHDFIGEE